jgi:Ser/Thr protein kinase RdoA (MazF antagonist)
MVEASDALGGRVSVVDLSRSNLVSLVVVDGRPVAVVKRGRVAVDDVEPFAAEVAAYRWLRASPATAVLAPRLLSELSDDGAVVLEPVPGAVSLHEALAASPGAAAALPAELGGMLGVLHAAPSPPAALVARRPWVLGVPAGRAPAMFDGHAAVAGALDRIRSHRALAATIALLDSAWTARTAIHGDVKFDNVLVGGGQLWLVDWELAGRGEPVWDLAGVIDGLLVPILVAGGPGPTLDAPTVATIGSPAVAAHRQAAGPARSPSPAWLATAVVARLAQTAVQLAAMGEDDAGAAEAAPVVLAAAEALADELVGGASVPAALAVACTE